MYIFKEIFYLKERGGIYDILTLSDLNYLAIIWHVCGKVSSKKIERYSIKCFEVKTERSNNYILIIAGNV